MDHIDLRGCFQKLRGNVTSSVAAAIGQWLGRGALTRDLDEGCDVVGGEVLAHQHDHRIIPAIGTKSFSGSYGRLLYRLKLEAWVELVLRKRVYPSGAARLTACAAIWPSAPV